MRSYGRRKAHSQNRNCFPESKSVGSARFPHRRDEGKEEESRMGKEENTGRCTRRDGSGKTRLDSKRHSPRLGNFHIQSIIEFSTIYHQNAQLSMKREALAHLPPLLSGSLSHCGAGLSIVKAR